MDWLLWRLPLFTGRDLERHIGRAAMRGYVSGYRKGVEDSRRLEELRAEARRWPVIWPNMTKPWDSR